MKQQIQDIAHMLDSQPKKVCIPVALTWLALVAAVIGFWIGAILCVI